MKVLAFVPLLALIFSTVPQQPNTPTQEVIEIDDPNARTVWVPVGGQQLYYVRGGNYYLQVDGSGLTGTLDGSSQTIDVDKNQSCYLNVYGSVAIPIFWVGRLQNNVLVRYHSDTGTGPAVAPATFMQIDMSGTEGSGFWDSVWGSLDQAAFPDLGTRFIAGYTQAKGELTRCTPEIPELGKKCRTDLLYVWTIVNDTGNFCQ